MPLPDLPTISKNRMNTPRSPILPSETQRHFAKAIDEMFHAQLSRTSMGLSPISLTLAFTDWAMHLAASPGRQLLLAQQAAALSYQALTKPWQPQLAIDADAEPIQETDPRFSDAGWSKWPFNLFKESFKASDAWWREATQLDGVSRHHHHIMNFFTLQGLDALSPSNWPVTNPEVLKTGLASLGRSWIQGYQNYAQDLIEHPKALHNNHADTLKPLAFEVGKDVALTPGKVVFRNHLIELIQYTPTTGLVYPEPLLIVPSCIMKYYILDLSPANSMVKYLVGQGYTVFMISWRNPDAADRDLGMQDYLRQGVMEAMAAVKSLAKAPRIHALGYCLGGTFLSIVAAALGREEGVENQHQLPELASVTLLAALTDFSEPGELGVFIDDDQLKTLRAQMARTGYLSGRQMADSFQFLNSRSLVWSRNTNRYLLGQNEVGNDMMSWNADVTRLPERMHSEYLSSLYLDNALAAGRYRFDNVGLGLKDIKAPMLVIATARDHIAPWRSVYKIHLLTDTPITFILAAGGHNAGIISEPGHPRRSYQMDGVEKDNGWNEPDEWSAKAPQFDGSWWVAMHNWLHQRSGAPVPPPPIDPATILGNAPGDYVMVRYAD
jgi:polyhydroxyalkanoate synthase